MHYTKILILRIYRASELLTQRRDENFNGHYHLVMALGI